MVETVLIENQGVAEPTDLQEPMPVATVAGQAGDLSIRKNDHAVDRMVAIILEFGLRLPLLIRGNGELIDGHLRLKAAQKLKISEVPVLRCDEWTDAQVKAFRLAVNRSATWAEWDWDVVAQEIAELQHTGLDLALTGFDAREIDRSLH